MPLVIDKAPDAAVFQTSRGELVRHHNLRHPRLQKACKAAGLTDPRPTMHDARHTHAAFLIDSGVQLPEIQCRLGHESISTTVDTYGYRMKRADAMVLSALDRLQGDPARISSIPISSHSNAKGPSDPA